MKNCDEMVRSLIERRDQYAIEQKRKKTKIVGTLSSLCCVCLVVLAGFGVWMNAGSASGPDYPDISADSVSNAENSTKIYKVISLSVGNTEEFAADMYRPEGFDDNIGSALALKMSITVDDDYAFPVIVCLPADADPIGIISDTIGSAELMYVNISGEGPATDKYYSQLTARQITALAKSGAKCYYVGSGEGDYKAINWDTAEGINAYCELHGDMYIAGDSNIEHSPDINIE